MATVSAASLTLAWDPVEAADLYRYEVLRGTTAGGPYERIGTSIEPAFTDDGVDQGSSYVYVIVAVDTSFNRSQESAEVAAAAEAREVAVTFTVTVPPNTPADDTVYIAGDFQGWDPGGTPMERVDAATWSITLPFTEGEPPQYKYTRGTWEDGREGRGLRRAGQPHDHGRLRRGWDRWCRRHRREVARRRPGPLSSGSYTRRSCPTCPSPYLPDPLARRLAAALDVEGKIPRALDALGPLADRDVAWVGNETGMVADRLTALGARVRPVALGERRAMRARRSRRPTSSSPPGRRSAASTPGRWPRPTGSCEAGGRLLIVHDYGRDDVSRLNAGEAERPEYSLWSRRDGPFLANGFKVRVVHCWWTFDSVDDARAFLGEAFGEAGRRFGEALTRPRLSYNVAIYHRTIGGTARDG